MAIGELTRALSTLVPICILLNASLVWAQPVAVGQRGAAEEHGPASANIFGNNEPKQGWTSSPDGRGTLDILWSSIATSFLCCWTVICPNVPGKGESSWAAYRRKTYIALFALLAPEVVGAGAAAQYFRAAQSVREFKAAGVADWTMKDAFIVDMGGLLVRINGDTPIRIKARQLLWMIRAKRIEVPRAQLTSLRDRNKVDGVLRLIALVQALWYSSNIIGRIVRGIAITTIEVTTNGCIFFAIPISFFWWHKPADIGIPEILEVSLGPEQKQELETYSERDVHASLALDGPAGTEEVTRMLFTYGRDLARRLGISKCRDPERACNFESVDLPPSVFRFSFVVWLVYNAPFLAVWTSSFPTRTEQVLWRASVMVSMLTMLVGLVTNEIIIMRSKFRTTSQLFPPRKGRKAGPEQMSENPSSTEQPIDVEGADGSADSDSSMAASASLSQIPTAAVVNLKDLPTTLRCKSTSGESTPAPLVSGNEALSAVDVHARMPTGLVVLAWIMGLLYIAARLFILVEDVIELRSLPKSAYQSVEWSSLLPHFS